MSSNPELKQASSKAAKDRKIKGESVRKIFWSSWIFASSVSIIFAFTSIWLRDGSLITSAGWDLINIVSVSFVFYTILSVLITHKIDERCEGHGIRDAHIKRTTKPILVRDAPVISAIMARQAIHVAIALGLLVVIFQNRFLVPKGEVSTLADIIRQFQPSVAWVVTGGFSLSVVLILVSALCYDYSCRFNWTDECKRALLYKGLTLDIWAWYTFTVSLILSIALVSPLLCILINAGYGFLLLHYYFFDYAKSETTAAEPVG